jgi:hypothetical protein
VRCPHPGHIASGDYSGEGRLRVRYAAAEDEALEEVGTKLALRLDGGDAIAGALDRDLPSGDWLDAGEREAVGNLQAQARGGDVQLGGHAHLERGRLTGGDLAGGDDDVGARRRREHQECGAGGRE